MRGGGGLHCQRFGQQRLVELQADALEVAHRHDDIEQHQPEAEKQLPERHVQQVFPVAQEQPDGDQHRQHAETLQTAGEHAELHAHLRLPQPRHTVVFHQRVLRLCAQPRDDRPKMWQIVIELADLVRAPRPQRPAQDAVRPDEAGQECEQEHGETELCPAHHPAFRRHELDQHERDHGHDRRNATDEVGDSIGRRRVEDGGGTVRHLAQPTVEFGEAELVHGAPTSDVPGLCHARHDPSGGDGGDDVVGGVGEVGEAVGQAGAGEDEVVGVLVFGGAELGEQVQVVAQGLQFGVGGGGQVVAGFGERSVLHGGVLPRARCKACLRARHAPAGCREGRSCNQPAGRISPKGVLFRHPPDVERTASEAPDALGIRNPPELPGRVPLIAGDSTLLGGKFASEIAGCLFTFSSCGNLPTGSSKLTTQESHGEQPRHSYAGRAFYAYLCTTHQ